MPEHPSKDLPWKPVLVIFALTLFLYLTGFYWIEGSRQKNGPWKVTFGTDADSTRPEIIIEQEDLGIRPTAIIFEIQENLPLNIKLPTEATTLSFDLHQQDFELPFGEIKYRDPTFLPGVVTIELFGTLVEFLPRTLIINREEIPWNSRTNITIDCSSWSGTSPDEETNMAGSQDPSKESAY